MEPEKRETTIVVIDVGVIIKIKVCNPDPQCIIIRITNGQYAISATTLSGIMWMNVSSTQLQEFCSENKEKNDWGGDEKIYSLYIEDNDLLWSIGTKENSILATGSEIGRFVEEFDIGKIQEEIDKNNNTNL